MKICDGFFSCYNSSRATVVGEPNNHTQKREQKRNFIMDVDRPHCYVFCLLPFFSQFFTLITLCGFLTDFFTA
jgi:hypothetical protein